MHEDQQSDKLLYITKTNHINLPKLTRFHTIDKQQEAKAFNDQQCQRSIFHLPIHQIKRKQITINYRYCFDNSKKKLFRMQSRKKLKKRITPKQIKLDQQKTKSKQLSFDSIDLIIKKKSQLISQHSNSDRANSNRTPQKFNYLSSKKEQKLSPKHNSNTTQLGLFIKNSMIPNLRRQKDTINVQSGPTSTSHRYYFQSQKQDIQNSRLGLEKIIIHSPGLLSKFSPQTKSNKYRKSSYSQNIQNLGTSSQLVNSEITILDPWSTQMTQDLGQLCKLQKY